MKREERKKNENIEKLQKVLEEKKKIPKNIRDKINGKIFENVAIAAIIMIYLVSLNFGIHNIPTETYIMDLKVFSMMLMIITIFIFEFGYKKDNDAIWIHGVEVMVIAVLTSYLVYLYSIYYANFDTLIVSAVASYLIYYAVKILITRKKIVKQYNKSLTDINEIVKK